MGCCCSKKRKKIKIKAESVKVSKKDKQTALAQDFRRAIIQKDIKFFRKHVQVIKQVKLDDAGDSLVHLCCEYRFVKGLKYLLSENLEEHFAPYCIHKNNAGAVPLNILLGNPFSGPETDITENARKAIHVEINSTKPTQVKGDIEEMIIALLEAGADCELHPRSAHFTGLMIMCMYGYHNAVEVMHVAGANFEAINMFNDTAFLLAAEYGHTKVVEIILKCEPKTDLQTKNIFDNTAMMLAAQNNKKSVIKCLINQGAVAVPSYSKHKTPLKEACKSNAKESIVILLGKAPRDRRASALEMCEQDLKEQLYEMLKRQEEAKEEALKAAKRKEMRGDKKISFLEDEELQILQEDKNAQENKRLGIRNVDSFAAWKTRRDREKLMETLDSWDLYYNGDQPELWNKVTGEIMPLSDCDPVFGRKVIDACLLKQDKENKQRNHDRVVHWRQHLKKMEQNKLVEAENRLKRKGLIQTFEARSDKGTNESSGNSSSLVASHNGVMNFNYNNTSNGASPTHDESGLIAEVLPLSDGNNQYHHYQQQQQYQHSALPPIATNYYDGNFTNINTPSSAYSYGQQQQSFDHHHQQQYQLSPTTAHSVTSVTNYSNQYQQQQQPQQPQQQQYFSNCKNSNNPNHGAQSTDPSAVNGSSLILEEVDEEGVPETYGFSAQKV